MDRVFGSDTDVAMTATFKVTAGILKWESKWGSKRIDQGCLDDFWRKSASRHGVYVFGIRAAKGWKPLYVGRTKKQTFRKRMDQHIKYTGDFDAMLKGVKKGTPVLFLIGQVGKGMSSNSAIDELEVEVINYADTAVSLGCHGGLPMSSGRQVRRFAHRDDVDR